MKRLTLFLVMALAFSCQWAQAQETLTVYDGGSSSSQIPFNGLYADTQQRSELIMPSTDLSAMSGKQITQIAFYMSKVPTTIWGTTYKVYLKEITAASFDDVNQYFGDSDATIVYLGTVANTVDPLTITFSTPYVYNGGNLLIGIQSAVVDNTKYGQADFVGSGSETKRSAYTGTTGGTTFNKNGFLPKTTFTYESTCIQPSSLNAEDITTSSATLTWVAGGSESAWNLRYKESSASSWTTISNLSSASYSLSNLSADVNYEFQVQAICGTDEESDWASSYSFSTGMCEESDKCNVTFEMADSYGDGWNGASVEVYDVLANKLLASMTLSSGYSNTITKSFCDGRQIRIVWQKGSYDSECSLTVKDANGETIYSFAQGTSPDSGTLTTYTVSCSSCFKPSDLAANDIDMHSATITWTAGTGSEWQLRYKKTSDVDYTTISGTLTQASYELTGLSLNTEYTVEVSTICDVNEESDWATCTFTTLDCAAPTGLAKSDVTTSHAVITWTAGTGTEWEVRYKKTADSEYTMVLGTLTSATYTMTGLNANTEYTVEVRNICNEEDQSSWASLAFTTSAVSGGAGGTLFSEGFEDIAFPPTNWTIAGGSGWQRAKSTEQPYSHSGVGFARNYSYYGPYFLITPQIAITGVSAQLSFYSCNWFQTYFQAGCRVMISTTTNDRSAFTTTIWNNTKSGETWQEQVIDLTSYIGQNIYLAFVYETNDGHQWCVDDVTITSTGASAKTFTTAGNWDTPSNWSDGFVPTISDDIIIAAAATIPANSVAYANSIILDAEGSITIADGGQLVHSSDDLAVTMQKSIAAYTSTLDNYYFVASPIVGGTATTSMASGEYDLYGFDQTQDKEEWQNHEVGSFSLSQGQAYLYANSAATTLSFTGTVSKSDAAYNVAVSNVDGHAFSGFNLVGNPFTCNASVSGAKSYYQLNTANDGEVIIINNPVVAPCTGIFAVVENDANVSFTKTSSTANVTRSSESVFNIELSHDGKLTDRAYLSVNGESNVKKLNLRENSSKIFFMAGRERVAKTAANGLSTLPLYFEAESNGTYTIRINMENLSCGYLHLIDNLTGADVDMIANNSYSFQANINDYSCRFKLVFSATGIEEGYENNDFVIVDGKRLFISEVEGQVDIIDMMGRTISSQTVNGSYDQTLEVSAGIYFVRANGMVQKVVLK